MSRELFYGSLNLDILKKSGPDPRSSFEFPN
jgi:hypothetical protein